MNSKNAARESTLLREAIRNNSSMRSNPTNWYHQDYQIACNRFLVTYLFGMYLIATYAYRGLSGLLGGILTICLTAVVVVVLLFLLVAVVESTTGFWKWVNASNDSGNY